MVGTVQAMPSQSRARRMEGSFRGEECSSSIAAMAFFLQTGFSHRDGHGA